MNRRTFLLGLAALTGIRQLPALRQPAGLDVGTDPYPSTTGPGIETNSNIGIDPRLLRTRLGRRAAAAHFTIADVTPASFSFDRL